VWDGNETWLVLAGTILFGAFPRAYSVLLEAFYLPIIILLIALILRGVAFEFRYKTVRMRWLWDRCFAGGSLVAAFVQGMTVGALVEGLPVENARYAGGPLSWLSPFACLCGVALCVGYALLGAAWLVNKTDGALREHAYRLIPRLLGWVVVFIGVAFCFSVVEDLQVLSRWLERPYFVVLPVVMAISIVWSMRGVRRRIDSHPIRATALLFLAAFAAFGVSFWPYVIPFSLTLEAAASPPSSLRFMFWGAGLFVLPLTIIYTGFVYRMFAGKVAEVGGYE
jgi:cytochrome d ubiquinol oxidase subunit II